MPKFVNNHPNGFSNQTCNEPMFRIFFNHRTEKHFSFEICLRFKAIAKGNPPTMACQRNIFA